MAGNLAGITDAAGNDWSCEYAKRGNQTRADAPNNGTTLVSYDTLDRPVSTTDARDTTMTTGTLASEYTRYPQSVSGTHLNMDHLPGDTAHPRRSDPVRRATAIPLQLRGPRDLADEIRL
ncbi:hypothetical protein [Streptomyces sedi]|uniref:hypothetical protein n=1 Tax=Streptomyces sedi TaxID=555059 RepID=UPI0014775BBD|nr:hypothetical protein [Streptomyces sedi]